jgi:dTDP-4-dehydrorhamnose reductase
MLAECTAIVLARSLEHHNVNARWPASGVFHVTAGGSTSWAGFAQAILDDYQELADLNADTGEFSGSLKTKRVIPITTEEYPLPARRPQNSVLSNGLIAQRFGIILPDWRSQLRLALQDAIRR